MMAQNHFYGHSRIFHLYCSMRTRCVIPGHVQHGWRPDAGHSEVYFKDPWPAFVWARHNREAARAMGYNAVAVGSPYLYLLKLHPVPEGTPAKGAKSLLAFPPHGWEKERLSCDLEEYAAKLDELRREGFDPITVCLYWFEYSKDEYREPFERRGYEIICNGHRDDEEFLFRQRRAICEHAFVTSNRLGSSPFYALASGRPFFLYGPPSGLEGQDDPTGAGYHEWQRKTFPELTYEKFDGSCLRDLGYEQLGFDCMLSSEELKRLFAWTLGGLPLRIWRKGLFKLKARWPWLFS